MNLPQVSNEFAFWFFLLAVSSLVGVMTYDLYRNKDKKSGKNH